MLHIDPDFIWKRSMQVKHLNDAEKYSSNIICKPLELTDNLQNDWVITINSSAFETVMPYAPFRQTEWHQKGPEKELNVVALSQINSRFGTTVFKGQISTTLTGLKTSK